MSEITVAYNGVHQIYQLALAAAEMGCLDRFYCSVFAGAGKWGGTLAWLLGKNVLKNRHVNGINTSRVHEHPWPLFYNRLRLWLQIAETNDWEQANIHFDSW